jgi:ABC-type transport system involved in multi-copper enzyme maturation permease subunit
VGTLYIEELKASMRGRFAWLGAAVVLLAVGAGATIGTQDTWLDGYGVIAYFLVPLAFIPFAAGAIASPRANRFVESVFTTPVDRREWFLAKVLVLFTLAVAYYLALVPMMLVYIAHVGVPLLLTKLLLWAPGLLLMSISVGVLVGVMFIGRSIAAPAATGMGLVLLYAGFVPLQELMVARGNGATRMGIATLVSPAVLLKNALGFTIAIGSLPATTTGTWISIVGICIGALAFATWVFLRAQGVETWEASQRQRWIVGSTLIALVVFPLALADRNYDRPAPPVSNAPPIRALFARGSGSIAMSAPGGPMPVRCCNTILNRDTAPIGIDEGTRRDLFVLLPVEVGQRITDLRVQVSGDAGLGVTTDSTAIVGAGEHLETRDYPDQIGPPASDGHRISRGWVVRIPVTLRPTHPWDIGGVRYPLDVKLTYHVGEDGALQTFTGRAAVEAEVSSAVAEMGAVSAILPACCLIAAFVRWRRTR